MPAAVKAMETVDTCLGKVVAAVLKAGGRLLVTADHGNCEKMRDASGQPHTAHTDDLVPLILVDKQRQQLRLKPGILADLAPTILDLMSIEKPGEMTGQSLIAAD
jgi:2,3-bisphosphoglycerate-independent phosphoglycerate mutase